MRWTTKCICFKKQRIWKDVKNWKLSLKILKTVKEPKRHSPGRLSSLLSSGPAIWNSISTVTRSYPALRDFQEECPCKCSCKSHRHGKTIGPQLRVSQVESSQFSNSSLRGVLLNGDGTPRFTCNSVPPENPEELQCAFQNWSHSWYFSCVYNLWYNVSPMQVWNKTIQL